MLRPSRTLGRSRSTKRGLYLEQPPRLVRTRARPRRVHVHRALGPQSLVLDYSFTDLATSRYETERGPGNEWANTGSLERVRELFGSRSYNAACRNKDRDPKLEILCHFGDRSSEPISDRIPFRFPHPPLPHDSKSGGQAHERSLREETRARLGTARRSASSTYACPPP